MRCQLFGDEENNCDESEQCLIHSKGEGCVMKYHQLWVEECPVWQNFKEVKNGQAEKQAV